MKSNLFISLLVLFSFAGYSQNYYKEYPISISIASNGNQSRIECSTFDSILQTTVAFQTEWVTYTLIVNSSVLGKFGYTFWNGVSTQIGKAGFVIYDSYSHEFVSEVKDVALASNEALNVICGPVWVEVVKQIPQSSYYTNEYTYYRYNTIFKKWIAFPFVYGESATPDVFSLNSIGNTDRLTTINDHTMLYYDPVKDTSLNIYGDPSGNINWWNNKYWEDCNIRRQGNNTNYDKIEMYDPLLHELATHPRNNLISDESRGIFFAYDSDSSFKKFFLVYDLSIQQWITDSVYSSNLTNIIVKDRVVAWRDSTIGQSKKVYCMVYNPISHSWIKDSTATLGAITGYQIQNGTIKWNDSNGSHARGYDSNLGWGNYNTTMLLNFHLTDFTNQGYNMIHVRNYSIGSDSIFFDFGDGVVSSNKRNVLWHTYNESGTYDVCIHDSTGTLSSCQQVTLNLCSASGNIFAGKDTLCLGDSTILTLTSYVGSIQWQSKLGNSWVDEIGPGATTTNYSINPVQTTSYRVKIKNGVCVPAYSNDQLVKVYPTIENYELSDSTYSRCAFTANQISVNIPNYTYQWQKYISNGWTNIPNANQMSYNDYSFVSILYRVLVSSGNCFVDTSAVITVNVVTAPTIPIVTSGSTCGPGNALLGAISNSPNHYWYANSPDTILHIGNNYNPYVSTNTVFNVNAVDGALMPVGYTDNTIGSTGITGTVQEGIRFFCNSPGTLEYFYIYPLQTGYASISLKKAGTQIDVRSIYKAVQAGSGPIKVWMQAALYGNTMYDLIVKTNSVPLSCNTNGMSYPISVVGNPITILGYVDSIFHTTNNFYNFYDLNITTGCKSYPVNDTALFYSAFNIASITPGGPLSFCQGDSVKLSAYLNVSFGYEWKRNGVTVSTSGNTYWAKTPGSYTVIMNNANCFDTSSAVKVRVPCIKTFDPQEKGAVVAPLTANSINMFYDPLNGNVIVDADLLEGGTYKLLIVDPSGREVYSNNFKFLENENYVEINFNQFASGVYILKLSNDKERYIKRLVKY